MKTDMTRKIMCVFTALILVVSAMAFSTSAEDDTLKNSIKRIATVDAYDNDILPYDAGLDYGYPTTINAVQNPDGTYCICLVMADNSLRILELNADFTVKSSFDVAPQLECFVAFCKGEDGYYYVVFNQSLTVSTRNNTSLRLLRIGSDGKILNTLDFSGMVTGSWLGIGSLNCGNHSMVANESYLTLFIGRDMFPVKDNPITGKDDFDPNGEVHQASYALAVDLETFKVVQVESSNDIPYASHSFHQIVLKDGNDFLYVERGDALPYRAHLLTKMSGGLQWKMLQTGHSFEFKAEEVAPGLADNETYGQLGGVIRSGKNYMMAGTYQNKSLSTDPTSANVFVQLFDAVTLEAQKEFYLTDYSDIQDSDKGINSAANPKIVRVSDKYVAIPYMLCNIKQNTQEIHVILTDNSGNKLWDKAVEYNSDNPMLPKYGQVFYDEASDSIIWFAIVNGKLFVNRVAIGVPEEETTVTATQPVVPSEPVTGEETTTLPSESTSAQKPEESSTLPTITTAPNTTVPTTSAPTTTEKETTTAASGGSSETKLTLWDRIVNFFMGIYNFFVSLFAG